MEEGHVVLVRQVPGTEKVETDRRGRHLRTTATWHLNCSCKEWERTFVNIEEDTANLLAAEHERGQ